MLSLRKKVKEKKDYDKSLCKKGVIV